MTGPGGARLAGVKVQVAPDTSGFRQELQKTLDAIEKSSRLTIPVDADTSGLVRDVRQAAAALSKAGFSIPVSADTTGLRTEVATALAGMSATVPVDADPTAARSTVTALVAWINAQRATVKVDADTAAARADVAALIAHINAQTGTVRVKVDVDDAALRRLIGSLGGASGAFNSASSSASGFGSTIAGVAAGVTKFSVVAGALTYAVGAAGAAILTLPAAAAAGGAAFSVLQLGFEGFGDAIANAKTPEELKKQKEALDALGPSAQAAAVAFNSSMRPAIEGLRAEIQKPLFQGFDQMFKNLATTITTAVQPGLVTIAGSMNTFITSLAGLVTGAEGMERVRAALAGANTVITTMQPGVVNLVRELLNMAGVQPIAESLGRIIGGLAQQTADWLAEMMRMNIAVPAVQALEQAIGGIYGAFLNALTGAIQFFTRATPGVTTLATSIGNIAEQTLPGLGAAFGNAMGAAGRLLASVRPETWAGVVRSIEGLGLKLDELGRNQGVQLLVDSIVGSFSRLTLPFQQVIDGVNRLGDALGLAGSAGRPIVGILQALSDVVLGITTGNPLGGLSAAWNTLNTAFTDTPGAAAPANTALQGVGTTAETTGPRIVNGILVPLQTLPGLTQAQIDRLDPVMRDSLMKAVQGGATTMAQLPPELQRALTPTAPAVAGALAPTTPAVTGALTPATPAAGLQGMMAKNAFIDPLTGLPTAAGTAVAPVGPAVGAGLAPAGPAAGAAVAGVPPEIAGVGPQAGTAGQGVGQAGAQGVGEGIAGAPAAMAPHLTGIPTGINAQAAPAGAAGRAVGDAATRGIAEGLAPVAQTVSDGLRRAIDAINATAPQWQQAGMNLSNSLAQGILAGQSAVINAAIQVAQAGIQAAYQQLGIGSPSKVFRDDIGAQIPAGLALGVESASGLAVKSVISMAEQVADAAGSQSAWANIGANRGEALAAGLAAGVGQVVGGPQVTAAQVSKAVTASTAGSAGGAGGGGFPSAEAIADAIAAKGLTASLDRNGNIAIAEAANAGNRRLARR